ncbi:MAG: hypothetical protein JO122_07425 [Acetobacteraceae bacterium]|nr:hypothetical protein [Acetobacteraceae bacterium]
MINGFTDAQIIGALIAVLVASYAAFFGWLVTSISALRRDMHVLNRETRQDLGDRIDALDRKLTARIDGTDDKLSAQINVVDTKLGARIDAVDNKLSAKLDALTIAVSRLEGAVYHGLPEPRRAVSEQ